jgi:hypothetical protein
MNKGKVVFIDGASLSGMRYPLSIRSYDYQKLITFLSSLGSSCVAAKPLFVIPKGSDGPWSKSLRTYGYEVVVSDTKNGRDDRIIIQRIAELKPTHVDEVVIVSTDQDYAPTLQQKVKEGMRVFWVGTRNKDRDGTSPIGEALGRQFDAGIFDFVDLEAHRDSIQREAMQIDDPDNPRRTIMMTMRVPIHHSEIARLMERWAKLVNQYPGAQFTLESK